MKYHIEKNTVQETLVIPLFGRLVCSEHFPELFSDPEAKRICDSLDYDFADKRKKMESAAGLFGALEVAQRRADDRSCKAKPQSNHGGLRYLVRRIQGRFHEETLRGQCQSRRL